MPTCHPLHAVLLSSLFLLASPCVAAQSPLQVKSVSHQGKMPYVEPADAKAAGVARTALRINHAMYLELLELPAPARRQDGLKVKKSESPMAPISDISFVVDRSDARLLALSISAEGCGAYCEGFTRSFVFDADNGRRIRGAELFTTAGADAVASLLARQRGGRIKAEIAKLKAAADPDSKVGKTKSDEERDSSREAAEMYEACLPQYTEVRRGAAALAIDDIQLKAASVTFVRGRCSNHAMQALDSLGEFSNAMSLKDLEPHLSAYGKHLFGMGPAAPAPVSPFGQVVFGKVGTAPITMLLRLPYGADQSLGGLYFYDRFRTPISLFGPRRGEAWELNEEAPEGKAAPVVRLTLAGDRVSGEWIGAGKRLPLEAGP